MALQQYYISLTFGMTHVIYIAPSVIFWKAKKLETEEVLSREFDRVIALLGGDATFKYPLKTALDAHEVISMGFPSTVLTELVANVALIQHSDALEKAIGISMRTFQRRKGETTAKLLSPEQSGRAWKFAEILAKATDIFGSQEEAEQWLERPAIGLNQKRPIDLLSTPAGSQLVVQLLERIEFGVYT